MEISVVIPYFNREKFIVECVDSIQNQTYRAKEIVVVDDGSEPESAAFLATVPGIRVVTLPRNRGVGVARNEGFRAARYEWVAFQDSDDIWPLDKLEKQVAYLRAHPDQDGVQTALQSVYLDGAKSRWGDKPEDFNLREALRRNILGMQTLLIRKSLLEQVGGQDETLRLGEDHELGIRLALAGAKIGYIDDVVVDVRRFKHGHIEGNGLRYLQSEWNVLKRHWPLFLRELGLGGVRNYLAIAMRRAGLKQGHVFGRAMLYAGGVLGGFDLNTD